MSLKTLLPPAVARWLQLERFFNDRRANRRHFVSFRRASLAIHPLYRPERAYEWTLEAAFALTREVRVFGPLVPTLNRALGLAIPKGTVPVFIHPQSRAIYRRLIARRGIVQTPIVVTPTSSYRSLLAWHEERPQAPIILKVSLDVRYDDVLRVIPEKDIVRATIVSAMLSAIPEATRRRNGFDFFPETVACSHGGIGYIVRTFPRSFDPYGGNTLAPLFALTSRGPRGEPPLLVELIRKSRCSPEAYLVSKVIEPYVRALAYLLFEEGLQVEGHTQNICYELDTEGSLTGKVVLRDLSGTTVNPAMRLARGRRMPSLTRIGLSSVMGPIHRRSPSYAVEMFGLRNAVWKLGEAVQRYFPKLDRRHLRSTYLLLYQRAAVDALQLRPAIKRGWTGLALDEAIALYVSRVGDGPPRGRHRST